MNTCHNTYQFGPQDLGGGRTVFRLWAPTAATVTLFIETGGKKHQLAMARDQDGWFATILEVSGPCLYHFLIDNSQKVPDPASRYQPQDVHGQSFYVPPAGDTTTPGRPDSAWRGRPWTETVIYELHVGTFTPEGTLAAATTRLDYLADLGITAVELMPLADFPGQRNWGYDGALLFAVDSSYGSVDDLRRFIEAAHARQLMVFLDVVYNHFGPEGNYLGSYAAPFFTDRYKTPWGSAIAFQGSQAENVRCFFIENALYWFEEYGFDGLRFDAVHAIFDDSTTHILEKLARQVREGPGRHRHIHLMLENDNNNASYLRWKEPTGRDCYTAQWNDDIHHCLHVLLTGEVEGYYSDYQDAAIDLLGRCLTEGYAWQGEKSAYRGGQPRGEVSRDLMPTRFISFLQNHDQIGNRALGERISCLTRPEALRAATAVLLLGPSIPLLFMGQEWATTRPFFFFCDFGPELAALVTTGRREEFAGFSQFQDVKQRERIPDPNREETFQRSKLAWQEREADIHRRWLQFHRQLLSVRRERIVPLLDRIVPGRATYQRLGSHALRAQWPLSGPQGGSLLLLLNLGEQPVAGTAAPAGEKIWAIDAEGPADVLPPFFCGWYRLADLSI